MHHTPHAPRTILSATTRWLVPAVVALAAVVLGDVPATAQTDPTTTWAVTPADAEGPDDRAWMELTLDPGQSVTEHLAVTNLSAVEATFAITGADGYFTSSGRFNMLPSSEPSTEAGTWIEVDENVTVEAGETKVVPFTVTVPANTTPGDHAAGIAASVFTVGEDEAGAAVGVESRVGFRVLTRVTGDLDPSVAIEQLEVGYQTSWNPFAAGRVTVEHELVNDGNVRMQVAGKATSQGSSAPLLWEGGTAEPQELLPGDSRTVSSEVRGVWPFFRVSADVVLRPEMLGDEGGPEPIAEVRQELAVWAMPWSQLLLLLVLVVAVVLVRRSRKQREARQAALIEAAKDEVRREMMGAQADPDDGADEPDESGPGEATMAATGKETDVSDGDDAGDDARRPDNDQGPVP